MRSMFQGILLLTLSIGPQQVLSTTVEKVLTSLAKKATIGEICEQIAFLDISEEYAGVEFEVLKNVNYYYSSPDKIFAKAGELDLLVLRDGEIFGIYEVKCRTSSHTSKKAQKQLQRFIETLERARVEQNEIIYKKERCKEPLYLKQRDDIWFKKISSENKHGFESFSLSSFEVKIIELTLGILY